MQLVDTGQIPEVRLLLMRQYSDTDQDIRSVGTMRVYSDTETSSDADLAGSGDEIGYGVVSRMTLDVDWIDSSNGRTGMGLAAVSEAQSVPDVLQKEQVVSQILEAVMRIPRTQSVIRTSTEIVVAVVQS